MNNNSSTNDQKQNSIKNILKEDKEKENLTDYYAGDVISCLDMLNKNETTTERADNPMVTNEKKPNIDGKIDPISTEIRNLSNERINGSLNAGKYSNKSLLPTATGDSPEKTRERQEQEPNLITGQDSDDVNNSMIGENYIETKSNKNAQVKFNEEPSYLSKEQLDLTNRQDDLSLESSSNLKKVNDNISMESNIDQNSNTKIECISKDLSDRSIDEKMTKSMEEEKSESPTAIGNQPPLENQKQRNSVSEDDDEEEENQLSEYEKMRLERIKRNREKLAKLGLEKRTPWAKHQQQTPKKPSHKKRKVEEDAESNENVQLRSSGRIRQRKNCNEEILANSSKIKANSSEVSVNAPATNSKGSKQKMPRHIYDELLRIKRHKVEVMKDAEKNYRSATREFRFAKQAAGSLFQKHRLDKERKRTEKTKEKDLLKALYNEIDCRKAELWNAKRRLDQQAEMRRLEQSKNLFLLQSSLRHAIKQYPLAMMNIEKKLSTFCISSYKEHIEREKKKQKINLKNSQSKMTMREIINRIHRGPDKVEKNIAGSVVVKINGLYSKSEEGQKENVVDIQVLLKNENECHQSSIVVKIKGMNAPHKPSIKMKEIPNTGDAKIASTCHRRSPKEKIDRRWVESDAIVSPFDSNGWFVPQVDDTVLYYPQGHDIFLKEHFGTMPTMNSVMSTRKTSNFNQNDGIASYYPPWYKEDYFLSNNCQRTVLNVVKQQPLLCKILCTCVEFPPEICKKMTTNSNINERSARSSVLRILLKPLSPLAVTVKKNLINEEAAQIDNINIKNPFEVYIFPSISTEPFILPYAWALQKYITCHADQRVQFSSLNNQTVNEGVIKSLSTPIGFNPIDTDNWISKRCDCVFEEDKKAIYDMIHHLKSNNICFHSSSEIWICGIWPSWNDVTVEDEGGVMNHVSCWNLREARKVNDNNTVKVSCPPPILSESSSSRYFEGMIYAMDEKTRSALELTLKSLLTQSYTIIEGSNCYNNDFSIEMTLEKILSRLKLYCDKQRCYYRSVRSILADLSTIFNNCCSFFKYCDKKRESMNYYTYNVIGVAYQLVLLTDRAVKTGLFEKKFLLQKFFEKESVTPLTSPVVTSCSTPYAVPDAINWMYSTEPDLSWKETNVETTTAVSLKYDWIPQAGDFIQYSKSFHDKFLRYHYCTTTATSSMSVSFTDMKKYYIQDKWLSGKIIHASERILDRSEWVFEEEVATATVFALTVQLDSEKVAEPVILFWRPCRIHNSTSETNCPCGLSYHESFIRPVHIITTQQRSLGIFGNSTGTCQPRLLKALKLLHHRSMNRISIDETISEEFQNNILYGSQDLSQVSTQMKDDYEADNMFYSNMLLSNFPQQHPETAYRFPELTLQCIAKRVAHHYYRHLDAIIDDLQQSFFLFASYFLNHLTTNSSRMNVIKRLRKTRNNKTQPNKEDHRKELSEFEKLILHQMLSLRSLYALVYLAVQDLDVFEIIIMGQFSSHHKTEMIPLTQECIDCKQLLDNILFAFSFPAEKKFNLDSLPSISIKIITSDGPLLDCHDIPDDKNSANLTGESNGAKDRGEANKHSTTAEHCLGDNLALGDVENIYFSNFEDEFQHDEMVVDFDNNHNRESISNDIIGSNDAIVGIELNKSNSTSNQSELAAEIKGLSAREDAKLTDEENVIFKSNGAAIAGQHVEAVEAAFTKQFTRLDLTQDINQFTIIPQDHRTNEGSNNGEKMFAENNLIDINEILQPKSLNDDLSNGFGVIVKDNIAEHENSYAPTDVFATEISNMDKDFNGSNGKKLNGQNDILINERETCVQSEAGTINLMKNPCLDMNQVENNVILRDVELDQLKYDFEHDNVVVDSLGNENNIINSNNAIIEDAFILPKDSNFSEIKIGSGVEENEKALNIVENSPSKENGIISNEHDCNIVFQHKTNLESSNLSNRCIANDKTAIVNNDSSKKVEESSTVASNAQSTFVKKINVGGSHSIKELDQKETYYEQNFVSSSELCISNDNGNASTMFSAISVEEGRMKDGFVSSNDNDILKVSPAHSDAGFQKIMNGLAQIDTSLEKCINVDEEVQKLMNVACYPVKSQSKDLIIAPSLYDRNMPLVKALFCSNNYRGTCARCSSLNKNLLYCRVRKRHNNPDLDLRVILEQGGINSLLKRLGIKPQRKQIVQQNNIQQLIIQQDNIQQYVPTNEQANQKAALSIKLLKAVPILPSIPGNINIASPTTMINKPRRQRCQICPPCLREDCGKCRYCLDMKKFGGKGTLRQVCNERICLNRISKFTQKQDISLVEEDDIRDVQNIENKIQSHIDAAKSATATRLTDVDISLSNAANLNDERLVMLQKANATVKMAWTALDCAKTALHSSHQTFSEEFISQNFPIDPNDKHYYYCVICGYGGDLLCCEGCSNVVHAKCAGLDDIPDGDWFCLKCRIKRNSGDQGGSDVRKVQPDESLDNSKSHQDEDKNLVVHNGSEMSTIQSEKRTLTALLQELNSYRQRGALEVSNKKGSIACKVVTTTQNNQATTLKATTSAASPATVPVTTSTNNPNPKPTTASTATSTNNPNPKPTTTSTTTSTTTATTTSTSTSTTTSIITLNPTKNQINNNNVNTPAINGLNNDISSSPNQKKTIQNNSNVSKSELLGAKILKKFEGFGEYEGTIIRVPATSYKYYRIRYVDGDEEDMSDNEVQACVHQLDKGGGAVTGENDQNIEVSVKKKRGRPRKYPPLVAEQEDIVPLNKQPKLDAVNETKKRERDNNSEVVVKRKRGRPRKYPIEPQKQDIVSLNKQQSDT